jgi:(3S)-malyl-CoA thioesterase
MSKTYRPFRSVLYLPASNSRALEKAKSLPADAIIFDLEDAVSIHEKDAARKTLSAALAQGGYGRRTKIVRINRLDTPWGRDDAQAVVEMQPDAVLLPKVDCPSEIDVLSGITHNLPIWAMIESVMGVLNVLDITRHPKLEGIVMGTNDLASEMRVQHRPSRQPLMTALGNSLLAARAADIVALDGVYNLFRDLDGLRRECEQGRDMGFDGKTLIHPGQIDVANEVFAPTPDEIDMAHRYIDAFKKAEAEGQGIAVVDGTIVENLHVETSRRVLAHAKAIAQAQSQAQAQARAN